MQKKKTYLVTGGAGFIGSHLCEKIIKEGHKVICFDNLLTGSLKNLSLLHKNPRFSFIEGDANKEEDIAPIFKNNKLDGVFHYASVIGVKRTLENPMSMLGDIDGIKNVASLAVKYGKPKIVFASSSEVYGEPQQFPEREDGAINPNNPYSYGVIKLLGERFFLLYAKEYNLKTCSLRFFNVYGPKQESSDYGFVVGIFIKKALKRKPLIIFGDGSQTRDFTFIDDNIEASWRAMESKGTQDGEVINVGCGRPTTIVDLAEKIHGLCQPNKKFSPKFLENRRGDILHRFPEIKKMVKLLNYRPKVSLDEGLKKTIAWYKKSYAK